MRIDWKKPALGFVLTTVLWLVSIPAAARAEANQPQAVFPETRHEFGSVMEGQEVRYDFSIENHGQAPLTILRVQPD